MKYKTKQKLYFEASLQIFLLVAATFAFAYIIKNSEQEAKVIVKDGSLFLNSQRQTEANTNVLDYNPDNNVKTSKVGLILANILLFIGKTIFSEESLVSALEPIYTCPKTTDGKICQEYTASTCGSKCAVACVPSSRENVGECKPGTCYDKTEGICELGAPKAGCEILGGKWFNDPNGNVQECRRGCCLIGDHAVFSTEQQCSRASAVVGITKRFRPEIKTELACVGLAKTQETGSCVFAKEDGNSCKFTTRSDCLGIGGQFYSGTLCSNPTLKTNCKAQAKVDCVEGKDEVYWFDSCGNRENIYDADKVKSYNSGKILGKAQSCQVESGSNFLANQKTCGNCNYLRGSKCGQKTATQKLADNSLDVVCRDLTCVDRNGNKRINGESWCVYQSSTGLSGERSSDTPGSRHFRENCVDGEVKIEPCADFRNELCVETKTPLESGYQFSSAACRINRWQECTSFNNFEDEEAEVDPRCGSNPDCFIKHVDLGKTFQFDMCLPKYAPGSDFGIGGSGGSGLCSAANKKCKVTYEKVGIFGSWRCKENCDCETDKFAEDLHDICMSLGDCGASVNYMGALSKNYRIKTDGGKLPQLGDGYIGAISGFAKPVKGKIIDPGIKQLSPEELQAISGVSGILAAALGSIPTTQVQSPTTVNITTGTATSGITGSVITGSAVKEKTNSITGNAIITAQTTGSLGTSGTGSAGGAAQAPFGAARPAAGGTSSAGTTSAAGGATSALGNAESIMGILAGLLGPIGLLISLFFAKKTKVITVQFKCYNWQPPGGGSDCKKCGSDGLPCSRYSCASLGQNCKLINEGNPQVECVDINPNDASAPIISPLYGNITEGYSYTNVSQNGFKIASKQDCLREYTPVTFGISLNEPGQCRVSANHTARFEDMEDEFGNNLYLRNQTAIINMPSLESLGISGYVPGRKADFNLYIRCQDSSGNKNVREYNINFCVQPGDDITAPGITSRLPTLEYTRFDATSLNGTVYVMEPSECKWDEIDQDYDTMNNSFVCNTDFESTDPRGWRCDTTFPVAKKESNFNVRCKDQPWLAGTENETKRNKNTESYKYVVKRSEGPLVIDSITPDNDTVITSGVQPVTVNVEVRTSGGMDGTAICYYLIGNQSILFYDTGTRVHTNIFNQFFPGQITLPVRCEDRVGHVAEKTARFSVRIDTDAPEVSRIYSQGGGLVIVTNENSQCSYVTSVKKTEEECDFDFNNATSMSGTELEHTASFNNGATYYIKCQDDYGNKLGTCNAIVRGGWTI